VPPQLLERESSLQQDLNGKAARQQILLSGTHTAEEAEKVASELRALRRDYDEIERQIRESAPHYAALTQPRTLTPGEIRHQLLDKDTALLEYALGDDRSYLWLVTQQKITSYELPPRRVIERTARQAYEHLVMRQSLEASKPEEYEERLSRVKKAEERYWIKANELSRMILAPVIYDMKQSRLLIVSEGALQYLPFGALPLLEVINNNGSGVKQREPLVSLIEKYEVVKLPSASTLAELRKEIAGKRPAPKTVAVIANPVFSPDDSRISLHARESKAAKSPALPNRLLPSWNSDSGGNEIPALPFSESEGRDIVKLVPPGSSLLALGFSANRSLLESLHLDDYRIIHFATHGIMNEDNPELSGLILSLYGPDGKRTENGFLRMHGIFNLKLNADLVVLSACQTGIGKEVKGEGLVGLTRGFMYAGASRVVASLWKVDDAATAALMRHFYRGVLQEKLSPAAALRQAQLKTMSQNQRWRSPYYWAAFVLQGEYR
jgi:CHAT domain-containing protein